MGSIVNREEIRRLEKAARDKDKRKLGEWAIQLEQQIRNDLEKDYKMDLADAIDNFMMAVGYTLHFSEETLFGQKRLVSFMEDLYSSIDMFRTGEYKPEEYEEELKKSGVIINSYDYGRVFKKYIEEYTERVRSNMKYCEKCKGCIYNVDVKNPETEKVEMNMCSKSEVLDLIMSGNWSKNDCEFKKENL